MNRPLYKIAQDIRANWRKDVSGTDVWFGAEPYLKAMQTLNSIHDDYGLDSAESIVAYFLANAQTWRGAKAREIKKELNAMLKGK